MIVYPAIDISDGKIVRLQKGNFQKKTIYSNNVKEQVKEFENNGAKWIHVVDLDGALLGENKNQAAIKVILENTKCKVQLGGGIRSLKIIDHWINLGVERVIIGTAAIENPSLVKEAIKTFPKNISIGLDLVDDMVAIKGWTKIEGRKKAEYYFQKFSDLGVISIIYTDINKDGLLKGPNLKKIKYFKSLIKVPLIASGGVSEKKDLLMLKDNDIEGVIVGKDIYDKKVDIKKIFSLG